MGQGETRRQENVGCEDEQVTRKKFFWEEEREFEGDMRSWEAVCGPLSWGETLEHPYRLIWGKCLVCLRGQDSDTQRDYFSIVT